MPVPLHGAAPTIFTKCNEKVSTRTPASDRIQFMRVHRRRLSFTGVICVTVSALFSGLASPAAEALTPSPIAAHATTSTATTSADRAQTLLAFDSVLRRPLAVLRLPGQEGVIIAHRG